MRKNKKEEINMKLYLNTLETLIKEEKIKFSFYNNCLLKLDLLQMYYNKHNDSIELEFRDVMGEHLKELDRIMNNNKLKNYCNYLSFNI